MIEHNAFIDSTPVEDFSCGCYEEYDLSGWNDTPPSENGENDPCVSPYDCPNDCPCDCPDTAPPSGSCTDSCADDDAQAAAIFTWPQEDTAPTPEPYYPLEGDYAMVDAAIAAQEGAAVLQRTAQAGCDGTQNGDGCRQQNSFCCETPCVSEGSDAYDTLSYEEEMVQVDW